MLFAWIPLYQIFFFKLSGIFQDLSQPVGFCRETIYGAEAWHLEKPSLAGNKRLNRGRRQLQPKTTQLSAAGWHSQQPEQDGRSG